MRLFRKLVILSHRYLGIALSLLIIMWFASGIVMIYAGGMPRLSPQARLDRLPALDLEKVKLSPTDAVARVTADLDAAPRRRGPSVRLLTVIDRPAYRVGGETVFADTGDVLDGVSLPEARTIVAKFTGVPEPRVRHLGTVEEVDQWTLGLGRIFPLEKFAVDDSAGTHVYLQPANGDIVLLTTRKSRLMAWTGTIPHWLYFTALRTNQPLWYRLVVWTSGAACVIALLGLILSVSQFKRTRPFRLSKSIPYSGWMRWHYITGAVFGLFTLTWAFSGLLSMEPFEWTNATGLEVRRDVFTGGPVDLASFAAMKPAVWERVLGGRAIKEVDFVRIQDEHYYVVRQAPEDAEAAKKRERLHQPYYVTGRAEPDRVLVNAATLDVRREPFSADSLVARLKAELPDVPIVATDVLSEYDSYYYSRGRQTPLPVVRVKFADPAETWVYVDPEMSQMLAAIHRLNRVERWFYNGLHSLDFAFWYDRRPLWDIGMIALLVGGLATSCLGLVMGVARMRRATVRVVKSLAPAPGAGPQPQGALSTAVASDKRFTESSAAIRRH
jgi:hypothetical protein